jgi:hypothetical protein
MKRPKTRRGEPRLYIESWQCLKCEAKFLTFSTLTYVSMGAHRPDQIACPQCHYIGRFRHWQADLPASGLAEVFPWPESQNLDIADAEQRDRMLALSAPSAREYYIQTDLTPWQIDQRPQLHTLYQKPRRS